MKLKRKTKRIQLKEKRNWKIELKKKQEKREPNTTGQP
jgi:hypothetical protein